MTLVLGKGMVEIDTEHGRLQDNFWGTNITVAMIGKRINAVGFRDSDGEFKPYPEAGSSFLYVPGFGDSGYHGSALATLMRVVAWMVKDKVAELIGRSGDRDFVNGGTMSNGNVVEEAIIYSPTFGYAGVYDYQAIFSFFPVYTEKSVVQESKKAKMQLNGEDRFVTGIRMQEDGSPKHFDSMVGVLDVRMENWRSEMEHIGKYHFPKDWEISSRATHALSVYFDDLMKYVNGIAHLIKAYYYEGKTEDEFRQVLRKQAVTDVDYEKCGLYMDNSTTEEYYAYPSKYSSSDRVQLYHTKDESGENDRELGIGHLTEHYSFIEGREYKEAVKA